MPGVLLLVTGVGRSGTSTMAGCLQQLGLHVPGPFLRANASNPKGFFESSWSVAFHNAILERAGVATVDGRPEALELVRQAVTSQDRAALAAFVAEQAAGYGQVVVKDPRTAWSQELWREAADQAGMRTCSVLMLRHPAEVVGSRATYYGPGEDAETDRRRYQVANLGRWVHHALMCEHGAREAPRSLVRYTDLLADWRGVAARLRTELGLRYETGLGAGGGEEIDAFVDPELHRHLTTWEELRAPQPVRELAEELWVALEAAADGAPVRLDVVDALAARYADLYSWARDLTDDAHVSASAQAYDEGWAAGRAETVPAAGSTRGTGVEARPVGEVPARDLVRVAVGRARRRLRRRLRPGR